MPSPVQEWEEGRGCLRVDTLADMARKAGGVFTRLEMVAMLAPALLEPSADGDVVAQRAAFMEVRQDRQPGGPPSQHTHPPACRTSPAAFGAAGGLANGGLASFKRCT